MIFNSLSFLIFFPIVCIGYNLMPYNIKKIWLLGCSYFFYGFYSPILCLLLFMITVVSYFVSRIVKKYHKKYILILGILLLLFPLFYFKYTNFLLENILRILNIFFKINLSKSVNIVLPVGISFYSFQAVGYVIDVYKNDRNFEKKFLNYALYISFFPQLVAGPLDEFIDTNENECSLWEEKLDSLLLAPVISKKWDYIFSRKYMYGLEHCNTIGAEKRTCQLATDILPYMR